MEFMILKTAHVLSSTLLFGTGLGTAFHMWATHRRGDVRAIASTARNVVLADWLFTASSGAVQPVTGFAMAQIAGYDLASPWLVLAYCAYGVAGACWLMVVRIQMRVARLAASCAAGGMPLPTEYHQAMRAWFWLGWPAFILLIGAFWLMVAKPQLW